jgi:hypothetical protein
LLAQSVLTLLQTGILSSADVWDRLPTQRAGKKEWRKERKTVKCC